MSPPKIAPPPETEIGQALRQLALACLRAGLSPPAEIRLADHTQFRDLRADLIEREPEHQAALEEARALGLNWFFIDGMRVTYAGEIDRMIEEARRQMRVDNELRRMIGIRRNDR